MKRLLLVVMAIIISMTTVVSVYGHLVEVNSVNASTCSICHHQTLYPGCGDFYEAITGSCSAHTLCHSTAIHKLTHYKCTYCGHETDLGTHVCVIYHTKSNTEYVCPYNPNTPY